MVLANAVARFGSLIQCDKRNITVDAIKKCEDSDDILVRMYESAARTTQAELTLPTFARGAALTDLMEREIGPLDCTCGKVTLTFHPFEIITLKIFT